MAKALTAKVEDLQSLLDFSRLPQHVAIIMDGNRRWAKEHHVASVIGHRAGAKALRKIVELSAQVGIKVLTAYAFSQENWHRPKEEVDALLFLFEYYAKKERDLLHKNGIKFQVIGSIEEMPLKLQKEFQKAVELTSNNNKLIFNLAVNYGSRAEWVRAVKAIATKVKENRIEVDEITAETIAEYLYTYGLPDPDLLIRTSGEQRVSNFLLWQLAYTELWFTSIYWPDFSSQDFLSAILEYQRRQRRFGGN